MKYKWDRQYLHLGVTLFVVIVCSILFYYVLFENHSLLSGLNTITGIIMPIIDGCVIAYLLKPIVNFVEQKPAAMLMKHYHVQASRKKKKILRLVSAGIAFLCAVLIVYSLLYLVVPQLFYSIESLLSRLPSYVDNFQKWILGLLKDNPEIENTAEEFFTKYIPTIKDWLNKRFVPGVNQAVTQVSGQIINVVQVVKNIFLGCFVALYILNSKDVLAGQFKKLFYAVLPAKHADRLLEFFSLTDQTFSGFLSGKLLDSLIIGIICFVYTSIAHTPYYMLISVVIGVTNIIPFFGPYIGAIPCTLLILIVDPLQALYFVIFIILLQTFDGNYLGPKILGNKTGIGGFFVLCAILIFGGLFGVVGMVIGVPTTAVIYAGIRSFSDAALTRKKMPTEVYHYMNENEDIFYRPKAEEIENPNTDSTVTSDTEDTEKSQSTSNGGRNI